MHPHALHTVGQSVAAVHCLGGHLLLGQGDGAVSIDREDQAAVDAQLARQLGLRQR